MRKLLIILVTLIIAITLLGGCSQKGVSLYFPEEETFWLVAEKRVIEAENMPLAVMNELLAGPSEEGLTTLIPVGVQIVSLEVQNGVIYVDFSSEFNDVNYGAGPEAAMAGMIVNTLTSLDGIDAVYLTVLGEIPECFEHIGSSGPFTWNESLLKNAFGWQ